MAFDQNTRGRLQKLVNACRALLSEDFSIQLQQVYGLDPNTGEVTPMVRLTHLDDRQRHTAEVLRQVLDHYLGADADDTEHRIAVIDRMVREQAFTVLNRMAALLMMEARGQLFESVSKGYQSRGFQSYARLAGTALGETGQSYQTYLFSLFDELAQELQGLFDRFAANGLLFPRETALRVLMDELNHPDITVLWAEDETIGWIYQYFNSKEERKAMRDASPAPRNSRELAVRNQFFTPRYVVEFLVDNTLGRIWYEATQGVTTLRERCQYLLCTPQDVFLRNFDQDDLQPGSVAALVQAGRWSELPAFDSSETGVQAMIEFAHCVNTYDRYPNTWGDFFERLESALRGQRFSELSTQELWDGLFLICRADRHGGDGSVYQERCFVAGCEELLDRVKSADSQRNAKLIAHHTVRDPRTLKLLDPACGSMHFGLYAFDLFIEIYREAWAWEQRVGPGSLDVSTQPQAGLKPLSQTYKDEAAYLSDVPRLVIQHNIYGVDIDPRAAQIASLALWLRAQRAWHDAGVKAKDRPLIGRGHVVAATAPPAERELRERVVANLDKKDAELFEKTLQLLRGLPELGVLLQAERELPHLIEKVYGKNTDLFNDRKKASTWLQIESNLHTAIVDFSRTAQSTYQSRLFAQDALQGLRLVDLCREVFDVVVMNPPFGALSSGSKEYLRDTYPDSSNDLLGIFVDRGLKLLRRGGRLGAITSRTCFFLTSFTDWRKNVVLGLSGIEVIADLGQGVMDDAMVEAAAYVLERGATNSTTNVIRAIADEDRQQVLDVCVANHREGERDGRIFNAEKKTFDLLPDSPFVYWVESSTIRKFASDNFFEPYVGKVRQGLSTSDNFRFVRTVWEVAYQDTVFCYYPTDGSDYCRFDDPVISRYLKWMNTGTPRWAFHVMAGASQPWYSPITVKVNFHGDGRELANFRDAKGKPKGVLRNPAFYHRPGFSWTRRAVRFIPYAIPGNCIPSASRYMAFPDAGREAEALGICASRLASAFFRFYGEKFEFPNFLVENVKMLPWPELSKGGKDYFSTLIAGEVEKRRRAYQNFEPFHEFVFPARIRDYTDGGGALAFDRHSLIGEEGERLVADAYGFTSAQAELVERDLTEAITLQHGAADVTDDDESSGEESDFALDASPKAIEEAHLSYLLGCAFGRWDIRFATGERQVELLADPFAPLPVCPPGMLQNDNGLPARENELPVDYPLSVAWKGVLVEDEGNAADVVKQVLSALRVIWKEGADAVEEEACVKLGSKSVRDYFQRSSGFFEDHLKRYTKSSRKAPIYWPLSTTSGSYTLWVYYSSLSSQTLYTAINDFLVCVWPRHLELSRSPREYRGHDEHGSSGVRGGGGDGCSLAEHWRAGRADCQVVCEQVAVAPGRERPGLSRRASTGGAAIPRCGCSTALAIA